MSSNLYKSVEYIPVARTIGSRVLEILRGTGESAGVETSTDTNADSAAELDPEGNIIEAGTENENSAGKGNEETGGIDAEEMEKIAAEAEERGYKRGFNDLVAVKKEKMIKKLKKETAQLDLLLRKLGESKFHAVDQATGSVMELALALSRRITRCETRFRPEVMAKAVEETIRKFVSSGEVTLRMNPSDLARFEEKGITIDNGAVRFVEDSEVSTGGFLLNLETGDVDGRLESVESEMADLLEELYGKGASR